jgi:hypothetical protein
MQQANTENYRILYWMTQTQSGDGMEPLDQSDKNS